eukprot:jgi/Astpho2/4636/Aster-00208
MGCSCSRLKGHQIHASGAQQEQAAALQAAEAVLQNNAQSSFADVYHTNRAVGHGAFAKVVECRHKETGKSFACKIIPRKATKKNQRQAVIKEMAIMLLIGMHPNTVYFQDAYEDEHEFHLVMELCSGGELFDQIKHMSEKEAAEISLCLAEFLAFCHSKGVVHRDLKPENMLLSSPEKDARVKIIDFGTSEFCAPGQKLQDKFGTPYYVAPEVLGKKGHNVQVDIWSAGVILYILLCGYPPFGGSNERSILARWKDISQEARTCIKRMLVLEPSKRVTAAGLLELPWLMNSSALSEKALGIQMLRRLQDFSSMSQMKRLALALLARNFVDRDVKKMKEVFWQIDKDKSGTLEPTELRDALLKLGIPVPGEADFQALFDASDINKHGHIDYVEFVATMLDSDRVARRDDLLQKAFAQFDDDSSGFITEDKLARVTSSKGFHVDAADIKRMIAENDSNGDGKIDYEEFKAMIQRSPVLGVLQTTNEQQRKAR